MISADDGASSVGWSSPCIRALPFASCYVYTPTDTRTASRLLRASIKAGQVTTLIDRAMHADTGAGRSWSIASFFPAGAIFIPVPGSSPSTRGGATASARVAVALWKRGLGKGVWFGLRRVRAVRKSATAAPGARPTLRAQFDTMVVEARLPDASHLVLIDDVVTKGRTMLAAAVRLREVFPLADIRGFALLRTMGYCAVVDRFLMPCTGIIEWMRDDARRSP
jgi:hypothetical protein